MVVRGLFEAMLVDQHMPWLRRANSVREGCRQPAAPAVALAPARLLGLPPQSGSPIGRAQCGGRPSAASARACTQLTQRPPSVSRNIAATARCSARRRRERKEKQVVVFHAAMSTASASLWSQVGMRIGRASARRSWKFPDPSARPVFHLERSSSSSQAAVFVSAGYLASSARFSFRWIRRFRSCVSCLRCCRGPRRIGNAGPLFLAGAFVAAPPRCRQWRLAASLVVLRACSHIGVDAWQG